MALTVTGRGSGSDTTAATSFAAVPTSNLTAGALAVMLLAVDNADTNGAAHTTFAVTDTKGNTWTRRVAPLYDPGAANAGVEGAIFTSDQDGGTLTTGDTITVTFAASTTVKIWNLVEVTATLGNPFYVTGGVGTGSATTSPTVTTGTIGINHVVFGALHNEYGTAQTVTADADTTNGTWSSASTIKAGTTAAGITLSHQRKTVTAAGTQTYDPTLGTSSDVILSWIEIGENVLVTPATATLTTATFAPTVSTPRLVTPSTASLTLTTFAPTVSAPRLVTPGTASLTLTTFAPSVSTPRLVTPATASLTLSTFAPTVSVGVMVTPATASLTTTTFAPTVLTPRLVVPATATLTTTTFAPTITTSSGGITITPATASLVLTAYPPLISNGSNNVQPYVVVYFWKRTA